VSTKRHLACMTCAIVMTLAAHAKSPTDPPIRLSNHLMIRADSTILWNGKKVDSDTLDRLFKNVAKRTPQPEINLEADRLALEADRLAKDSAIAKIVSHAQRAGVVHLGFTGVQGR
jgi:biopolymer transport protein ExbD